jgi:hypothetical protein
MRNDRSSAVRGAQCLRHPPDVIHMQQCRPKRLDDFAELTNGVGSLGICEEFAP